MKLFHHLAILLLGFALVTSCSDDNYHVTPKLDLTTKSLTFTKAAEEKSVGVTINENDEFQYSVSSPIGTDWIKATKADGGELKVTVLGNSTLVSRTATIKVILLKGNLTESISITQSAEDASIVELSEGDKHLNCDAYHSVVYITKNIDTPWSVETKDSWITITPDLAKDLFTIDVSANTITEQRIGAITVTCGDIIKPLEITQDGIIHFDLPFLDFGFNFNGPVFGARNPNNLMLASAFETARGSEYVGTTSDMAHTYKTKSDIIPNLYYSTDQGSKDIVYVVHTDVAASVFTDGRYHDYLESKGFIKEVDVLDQQHAIYWNKETKMGAEAVQYVKMIQFKPMSVRPDHPTVQTHEYKTFDEMPYPFMVWGKTAIEIQEWEAAQGSTKGGIYDKVHEYIPNQTKEPWCFERSYLFDIETTPATYTSSILIFSSIDYGFYPSLNSTYVLTNEFKALLAASGFVFDRKIGAGAKAYDIYYNDALKTSVTPQVKGFVAERLMPRFILTFAPQAAATIP